MLATVEVKPHQIPKYTVVVTDLPDSGFKQFPMLSIDADSYIVGLKIRSGIDFAPAAGRHHIAIGKGCSLAEEITFIIDINHDYQSVAQGELSCLKTVNRPWRSRRKGSIILQNDVWVGHGATIMSGVTLHNGCVVAAGAVVTKDVPPYAIAGGNPARVIRYRFDEGAISDLQKIAWWDWPPEVQQARREDFNLPVREFISKCLSCADTNSSSAPPPHTEKERAIVLLVADAEESFPLYPKVLRQYFEKDRPDSELLIYLPKEHSSKKNVQAIEEILREYSHRDCYVTLQTGDDVDEHMLFQLADYYVTTRGQKTVWRTCLADQYGVKILYGTDEPIFPQALEP